MSAASTKHAAADRLNPREHRALLALLAAPLTREQLDRVAGASNSPDLVARLRHGLGLGIPCEREPVKDRDGRTVQRGVYRLAPTDKAAARLVLSGRAAA